MELNRLFAGNAAEVINSVGVFAALSIAAVGWCRESQHRRKEAETRAMDVKRQVYFEAASTLHAYLVAQHPVEGFKLWGVLPRIMLVAPRAVKCAARAAAACYGQPEMERREACDALLKAMDADLGGGSFECLFGASSEVGEEAG